MAVFNNGYPMSYQPVFQPYTQPYTPVQSQPQNVAPVQTPVQQNGIIWVSGEAGAKAYLVAPNNTVQLWDSESQTIYLKSADGSGMPSMKVLDYTIRDSNKNAPNSPIQSANENLSNYATKDEIKAVSEQITALRDRVDNLTRRRRREEDENE